MDERLRNVYSDVVNSPGKFLKLAATLSFPEHSSLTGDFLGVVVSSTLPKPCGARASHRFCCSFFIIDPSHSLPSNSVCVNLFLNNPNRFSPAFVVGDIIYCRGMRIQKYRDFPQLVGNFEKNNILIFRKKRQVILDIGADNAPSSGKDAVALHDEDWSIHCYTNDQVTLRDVDSKLSAVVIRLSNWAHVFFQEQSLADQHFPHTNFLSIYHHFHLFQQKVDYNQIQPQHPGVQPAMSIGGHCGAETLKADIIGLVISAVPGASGRPSRIILWDGTGHGYVPDVDNNTHLGEIHRALNETLGDETWNNLVRRMQVTTSIQSSASAPPTTLNQRDASPVPECFQGTLLIIESKDFGEQTVLSDFLARFTPGKWIRIRSLTIVNSRAEFQRPVGEVRVDAHISVLQPYFRDVQNLVHVYAQRLEQFVQPFEVAFQQQEEQRALQRQQAIAASNATGNASSAEQRKVTKPALPPANEHGHHFTAFAWIWAFPAPPVDKLALEFCCHGSLIDWYPADPKEFVVRDSPSSDPTYRFVLRFHDDSMPAQVIFTDTAVVTSFLRGISPTEYESNPQHAANLLTKLQSCRADPSAIFELYVALYTKHLTPLRIPPWEVVEKPGKSGAPGKQKAPKKRVVKRLMALSVKAPFQLTSSTTSTASASASHDATSTALSSSSSTARGSAGPEPVESSQQATLTNDTNTNKDDEVETTEPSRKRSASVSSSSVTKVPRQGNHVGHHTNTKAKETPPLRQLRSGSVVGMEPVPEGDEMEEMEEASHGSASQTASAPVVRSSRATAKAAATAALEAAAASASKDTATTNKRRRT